MIQQCHATKALKGGDILPKALLDRYLELSREDVRLGVSQTSHVMRFPVSAVVAVMSKKNSLI